MAGPRWSELVSLWVSTSIHVDIAPDVRTTFIKNNDPLLLRQLNKLERKRCCHGARSAGRKTVPFRIIFGESSLAKLSQLLRPRLIRNLFRFDQHLLITPV